MVAGTPTRTNVGLRKLKNIPLIIRLLAKTIEDISPKYLFLSILLPFSSSRKCEATQQPTFWLQVSMTFSYVKWPDYLRCGMIWKMWIRSTKPVANDSSHTFFAAVNIKKLQTCERWDGPFKSTELFGTYNKNEIKACPKYRPVRCAA